MTFLNGGPGWLRSPPRRPATLELDTNVPALLMKIGTYPLNYGGLGAARSLGRAGVPVAAVVESRYTPLARSRYVRSRFIWPTNGGEGEEELLQALQRLGDRIGQRSVLVTTDDEAATFAARFAEELDDRFLFPRAPAGLVGQVASKRGLHDLCSSHGVARPEAAFPETLAELDEAAKRIGFPMTVKNREPWIRLRRPAVWRTTSVQSVAELRALASGWAEPFSVILQEHLPRENCEDWFFQGYFDHNSVCLAGYTGRKYRSWPHEAGVTACGVLASCPDLLAETVRFCQAIGYHGMADVDWRLDRRTGRFHLLDFNPRCGAHFRLFEDSAGLDVVRAMHLDLTGRPHKAQAMASRRFVAGHLDPLAQLAARGTGARPPRTPGEVVERAWWAIDDPAPAAAAMVWVGRTAAQRIALGRPGAPRLATRSKGSATHGFVGDAPRAHSPQEEASAR